MLTASPGQSVAHLTWTAVDGASTYNVYRSGTRGDQGAMALAATATQADDSTVTNFDPYWYEVTGVVDGVETAPSNQVNAFGYDLAHWTSRLSGNPLYAMLYVPASANTSGHDIYVATGESGLVLTSQDGTTWQGTSSPYTITALTYGNGIFVGIADSAILTSTDGATWTISSSILTTLHSVAYVQYGSIVSQSNLFIAVGDPDLQELGLYTSPDGKTWTERSCNLSSQSLRTVSVVTHYASFFTSFMAVVAGDSVACYSTDGTTWKQVTLNSIGGPSYRSSVVDPSTSSVWLADFYNGVITEVPFNFSSATLGTPSSTTLPGSSISGPYYTGITSYTDAAAVRHVVALRSDGTLYDNAGQSPGAGFTAITPTYDQPLQSPLNANAIASNGSSLFVFGASQQILRSDDGGGTVKVLHDDPGGPYYGNQSVLARDGTVVVDRGSGALWTSTDSATFTASTTGAPMLTSLPLVDTGTGWGLFYVDPATSLELYESTDAKTWAHTTVPVTACPACMVPQGVGGVVVSDANGYLVSLNEQESNVSETVAVKGTAAAGFTSALQTPTAYYVKLWSKGGSYYGLTGDTITKSDDGFTWTTYATLPHLESFGTTYYDDGAMQYVADEFGEVSTSTDGVTWSTPAVLDPQQRNVNGFIRLGDHLIAYGGGGLLAATTDGTTWTPIATGTSGNFSSASVTDRGLVVSGGYDVVLTAP